MRCQQCGQLNPENHKFCGMCGAKIEPVASTAAIDDEDPLDLEVPIYHFEDRAHSEVQEPAQLRENDLRRELVRDAARSDTAKQVATHRSSAQAQNFPAEIIGESEEREKAGESTSRRSSGGIGGPSLLGLSYEGGSNNGFVYDKPRNDGFVYDTDGESPEYLLEETRRSVSWRAWALFALLLVGAGLGYVQWRASHNQGRDLASILAGNGATVDPSGPVMADKAKPPAPKSVLPSGDASDKNPAVGDSDSSKADAQDAKVPQTSDKSVPSPESAKAEGKSDEKSADSPSADSDADSTAAVEKGEEAGNPESDGLSSKATKPARAKVEPVEQSAPVAKSLGDKDPLIVQAEKYIQGRRVPQNCAKGMNLLHQAMSAGNPAADVKMGALYWSGTCVTRSKVTAYQWFSRAHSLEPRNRWIERSRNSLWASMSADEKRKVGY